MKIKLKGVFSSYILSKVAEWIGEHLTDITILEINSFIYACNCKITKVKKHEILVEGE